MNGDPTKNHVLDGLMEEASSRLPVGAAPASAILGDGRRIRRRRAWRTTVAASVAVFAVAGGLAWSGGLLGGAETSADLSTGQVEEPAPAEGRWFGLGHVAVDVPDSFVPFEWCNEEPTDSYGFIDPLSSTISVGCGEAPGSNDPRGTRVVLHGATEEDEEHSSDMRQMRRVADVDGREVRRSSTWCSNEHWYWPEVRTCSATLFLPSEQVAVLVRTTDGEQALDDVFERVRVFDDFVAVPWYSGLLDDQLASLEALGLVADVTGHVPQGSRKWVDGLDPEPGTMVPLGSQVTVTIKRSVDDDAEWDGDPDS